MKRKVGCFDGKGKVFIEEQDIPEINPYEVLVEVKTSLISPGTEIGGIKNLRKNPSSSIKKKPFGYGNAGIILETGAECKRLKKGMRVACMGAGYALHTDYAVVPESLCVEIPENVGFAEGSFAHLAATSLHAVRRAELQFGEYVFVVGLGIIGNITGQISKWSGCHVIGTDLYELRRKIALDTGFDLVFDGRENFENICKNFTESHGIDCAFLCFGGESTEIFEKVVNVMKVAPDTHKMGRIVIPGGCEIKMKFGSFLGNLDIRSSARTGPGYHDPEYERGRDYPEVFIEWKTGRNLAEVIRAISESKISVKKLITHQFPLEEIEKACDLLIENPDKALGVILLP
ncbi:zinc-binding alcohol dehydrogenase [bacterium]|nr:zinc-binding alcohol dehydrogenase [bacterium]